MATITQMREVCFKHTKSNYYLIPKDLEFKFHDLSEKFYLSPTKENQKKFLDIFGDFIVDSPINLSRELYTTEKGIYDKRNEGLNEPTTTV